MAVALRGSTGGRLTSATVPWPAGTTVGDLALIRCVSDGFTVARPQSVGWTPSGNDAWWKVLTAADIAAPLPLTGSGFNLAVFTGAGSIGRYSSQTGVTVAAAGSGLWVDVAGPTAGVAPATYRLGAEWVDAAGWSEAQFFISVGSGYQSLPGVAENARAFAFEVVGAGAPGAPTLVSPGPGARFDASKPVPFSWTHNSPSPQTGYRLRISGPWWHNGAASPTWWDEEVPVTATASSVSAVLPGDITSLPNFPVQVSVSTSNAFGFGPYSDPVTFYVDVPPAVSGISVAAPAEDLTPVVSWDSVANYGSLTAYRVWMSPADDEDPTHNPVWDSGVIQGSASSITAPATTDWTNGQPLRAWVQVWQTGNVSTLASDAETFAVSWTAPAAPTITAGHTVPIVVTVGGLVAGDPVDVEQLLGGSWSPLASRIADGASLTVSSVLAAHGRPTAFRARRRGAVIDGVPVRSAWASTVPAAVSPVGWWLVDDADRSSAIQISVVAVAGGGMVEQVSVTYGLGASAPRVDSTPAAGEAGSLMVRAASIAGRDALVAWLEQHRVWWLVRGPLGGEPQRPVRASRSSARSWTPFAQTPVLASTDLPLAWVEQASLDEVVDWEGGFWELATPGLWEWRGDPSMLTEISEGVWSWT